MERLHEVNHESLLKSSRKYGLKRNQMEELTEESICGLYIWYKHGRRVICKGLEILEDNTHDKERHKCVVW